MAHRFRPRIQLGTPVEGWGRSGAIRKVIRGTIAIPNTQASQPATITAVNTSYAIVRTLGSRWAGGTNAVAVSARVELTDATTVTARHLTDATGTCNVGYEVIEFYPWALLSPTISGTISLPAATLTQPATVTTVRLANVLLFPAGVGVTATTAGGALEDCFCTVALTSATQVTAARDVGANCDVVVGYALVELR
jgi:hypothetical protein